MKSTIFKSTITAFVSLFIFSCEDVSVENELNDELKVQNLSVSQNFFEEIMGFREANAAYYHRMFVKRADGNIWKRDAIGDDLFFRTHLATSFLEVRNLRPNYTWKKFGTPRRGVDIIESIKFLLPYEQTTISSVTFVSPKDLFMTGSDGNLWSIYNPEGVQPIGTNKFEFADLWRNQGKPDGTSIKEAIGGTVVDRNRPYIFVKGGDDNLWLNWWSGSNWSWSNQKKPSRVSIEESMGVITVDGGRPYAFVKGSDGNLWSNWWSGSNWSWSNQGKPRNNISIKESMGAMTVDGGRPYIFVKGSDGNLWSNWWSGSNWSWSNQGRPNRSISVEKSMGSSALFGGKRPFIFVKGSDGNLWLNSWSGSNWSWLNLGKPSGSVTINKSMGIYKVGGNGPRVFIRTNDGDIWECFLKLENNQVDWIWSHIDDTLI